MSETVQPITELTTTIKVETNKIISSASTKKQLFEVVEATLVLIDFIAQSKSDIYDTLAENDLSIIDNVIDLFYQDVLANTTTNYPLDFELEYLTKSIPETEVPDAISYTFFSKEPINQFEALYHTMSNLYRELLTELLEDDIKSNNLSDDFIAKLKMDIIGRFFKHETSPNLILYKDIYNLLGSIFGNTYLGETN